MAFIAHGIAFCAASAGAAIVFYPYYPKILDQTDSASEAFGAFLTLCVILGVSVPLLHCCFLQHSVWLGNAGLPLWCRGREILGDALLSSKCNKSVIKLNECAVKKRS